MQYHKIQSVFKRDPATKRFLMWNWTLDEFEYLADCPWIGTEKIDGTNIRIYKDRIEGRTDSAQILGNLFKVLTSIQDDLRISSLPDDIVLYGEGYGAKIQSGGNYIPNGNSFALFDVMISGNYQPRSSVEDIADKMNLAIAPLLGVKRLREWVKAIESGEYRKSVLHPSANNEGVVLRPSVEIRTRTGDRIITKLKFKDFGL